MAKWRADKNFVTLAYFLRPPSLKDCKNQHFWSCILWTCGWIFIRLALILCLEGKRVIRFWWHWPYFYGHTSTLLFLFLTKCVFQHAISLNKYNSFNIWSLWHKSELIEIWESILADSINVCLFVCCCYLFFVVVVVFFVLFFCFLWVGAVIVLLWHTALILGYLGIAILAL